MLPLSHEVHWPQPRDGPTRVDIVLFPEWEFHLCVDKQVEVLSSPMPTDYSCAAFFQKRHDEHIQSISIMARSMAVRPPAWSAPVHLSCATQPVLCR
jgi:hypothetical protein